MTAIGNARYQGGNIVYYVKDEALYASEEARSYPHLDYLLQAYFHQDYDIFGHTLAEVVATYKEDELVAERQGTVSDIHRLLATYGQTEDAFANAVERIFKPGVIIEGVWDGLTTREWFSTIASLLS